MLHRFEIHSALELSRTALLGCHLAASRPCEAARWQLTRGLKSFAKLVFQQINKKTKTTRVKINKINTSSRGYYEVT